LGAHKIKKRFFQMSSSPDGAIFLAMLRFALLSALLCLGLPAHGTEDRVAAVVNDAVITKSELEERFALAQRELGQFNLSDRQRQALYQRTLAELVDEELQRQYASEKQIRVDNDDLQRAIRIIEQANNLPPGGYADAVKGFERSARNKIVGELRWRKIIDQAIRPQIFISNAEVDRLIRDMLSSTQVTEREISQIFIPIDAERPSNQIRQQMEELHRQLQQEDVPFAQLARTFSEDPAAERGGYIGWFAPGELHPALEKALTDVPPGGVSRPVKTSMGWHLIKVEKTRQTNPVSTQPVQEVQLWHILARKESDPQTNRTNEQLIDHLQNAVTSPADLQQHLADLSDNPAFSDSRNLGWQTLNRLPATIRELAETAPLNRPSPMVESNTAWHFVVVTERRTRLPDKLEQYRTRIRERLADNRVQLKARRFLRDLREKSFIDIRL
jgi:peptidyl-prolyl cis-trans isomerase SurA